MTVIAWDGTTLAADRRVISGYSWRGEMKKVFRANNGDLVGVAGAGHLGFRFVEWYNESRDDASRYPSAVNGDSFGALVIRKPLGTAPPAVLLYTGGATPFEVFEQYSAIGSGETEALVAMHCGRTAAEAVAVACVFDITCGDGCDTLTFE